MSVERFEVLGVESLAGGRPFGPAGPHEVEWGVAHLVVDPAHPANRAVVDLDAVATDDGLVRFTADYRLVRPRGATELARLLAVVPNRGMVGALPFSRDLHAAWGTPGDGIDAGDGFVLARGWAVLWCGWQWDVVRGPGRLGIDAPLATRDGRPITGTVRVEFLPLVPAVDHELSDSGPFFRFLPYPTVDLDDPGAELTVRIAHTAERHVVDRARWQFACDRHGRPERSPTHVWLEGGFQPFHYYELVYRTARSVVSGVGLVATRDVVSALRERAAVEAAVAMGVSQSGRFLRQFVYQGFNGDEHGRRVFDGLLPHVAGARRGEFNHRFAQPSLTQTIGFGHLPPFSIGEIVTAGADTGREPPKVLSVNTAFEYWRGDAAFVHRTTNGDDIDDPPWARTYLLAGLDHMGNTPMKELMPTANPVNTLENDAVMRALFVVLEQWVCDGVEPPPSAVPRQADGTIARAGDVLARARAIPALHTPHHDQVPHVHSVDLGPDATQGIGRWPVVLGDAHECWVSDVDADGNELAGIRVPLVAVPLGTNTGWNPRRPVEGLPDVLLEFVGSHAPFARTDAEQRASADPRASLAARYRNRDDYAARVRGACDALVAQRFLLPDDLDAVVDRAVAAYDRAVAISS